jgi:hypothetical protein
VRSLLLAIAVVAAALLLHDPPAGRATADPICVDTNPVYVLGREVLPATHHCTPTG